MLLPLSFWHVGLGWLDLITDAMGIASTWKLANSEEYQHSVCGANLSRFFLACFIVQLVLLMGNLVTQSLLAAWQAAAAHAAAMEGKSEQQNNSSSHKQRHTFVLTAAIRGFLNLELAYQEFKRSDSTPTAGGSSSPNMLLRQHTTAALFYRMAELVFEAPQVLMNWTVLLLKITADAMKKETLPAGGSSTNPAWLWAFQAISAGVGLVSLSIAAMEFMRLHPRSAWAFSKPPSKLLFGLIDVSETAGHSVALGLYAFFNLLNRAFLYLVTIQGFAMQLRVNAFLVSMVVTVVVGSFVLNVLLLIGIKPWFLLPAAVISMFINIPWTTGHSPEFQTSRWSCWPAWVMEFIYCAASLLLMVFAGLPSERNPIAHISGPCLVDYSFSRLFEVVLVTVMSVVCAADLGLFLGLAGWHSDRQRRYYKQHGSTQHMVQDLQIAVDAPACAYKWSRQTLCMMLVSDGTEKQQQTECNLATTVQDP